MTKGNWNLLTWVLNVSPGQDEYLIWAQNWGKPLMVMTQSDDPSAAEREIPIVNVQNMDFLPGQPGGFALPSWGTGEHTARSVAFYGKGTVGQGHFVKLAPPPSTSAAYTIWYRPGDIDWLALGDEILIPEHHNVLLHRVAIACLPYARWADLDIQAQAARRSEIGSALSFTNEMLEDSWQRYRSNQKEESMRRRVAWGEDGYY